MPSTNIRERALSQPILERVCQEAADAEKVEAAAAKVEAEAEKERRRKQKVADEEAAAAAAAAEAAVVADVDAGSGGAKEGVKEAGGAEGDNHTIAVKAGDAVGAVTSEPSATGINTSELSAGSTDVKPGAPAAGKATV